MDTDALLVEIAAELLDQSTATMTGPERRQQRRMAAVGADPALRELTFALTVEVLRMDEPRRAAERFRAIVGDVGVPSSLGAVDRWLLRVGARAAAFVPSVVMPLVRR